jgi:hypothetical protein
MDFCVWTLHIMDRCVRTVQIFERFVRTFQKMELCIVIYIVWSDVLGL